mmetsp:Transcript_27599/g.33526  ORF Transcript_27599/g.33526 Transcript_27599/m.33526 type:complete len:232 (+) Transcript_27599:36-731(+)
MPPVRFVSLRYKSKKKKPPRCLYCLISREKWKKVIAAIEERNQVPQVIDCCAACSQKVMQHPTLLHYACYFEPPLSVVKFLMATYPRAVFLPNALNQFPLHILLRYGTFPEVVEYVLQKNTEAAGIQDAEENSTLHLLFYDYVEKITRDNSDPVCFFYESANTVHIIRMLVRVAPNLAEVRDSRGFNALECAIIESADYKVIHLLESIITGRSYDTRSSWCCTRSPKVMPL